MLYLVLFSSICDFFQHEGEDIGGRDGIFLDGLIDRLHVLLVLLLVRSCIALDLSNSLDGFFVLTQRQQHFLYFGLIVVYMWVHCYIFYDVSLALERIFRWALGRRYVRRYLRLIRAPHLCYIILSVV